MECVAGSGSRLREDLNSSLYSAGLERYAPTLVGVTPVHGASGSLRIERLLTSRERILQAEILQYNERRKKKSN